MKKKRSPKKAKSKSKPKAKSPAPSVFKKNIVFLILAICLIAGGIFLLAKNHPSSPNFPLPVPQRSKEAILEDAKKGIENRKRDFTVSKLRPGKTYELKQVTQKFPFGTALSFNLLFAPKVFSKSHPSGYQAIMDYPGGYLSAKKNYLKIFQENFNGTTPENAFKWEFMNSQERTDWRITDQALGFVKKDPVLLENFRGHCVFWNRKVRLPDYLQNASQEEIREAVFSQRLAMIKRYPQIKEWDLINEPIIRPAYLKDGVDHMEVVFDPQKDLDFFVSLFIEARKINPQARYFVNENLLLSGKNTPKIMQFVKALTEKGAKPDGIGIEGHFSSDYNPFTLETAEKNLKELASLGLPLKITELDFPRSSFLGSEDPEQKRATYLKEMLTLFYGTPQIEGIYFWGFADPVHWKGNEGAGLFDSELKIKIAGEEFQKLTQEEWVTKETKTAEDNGIINFRGFPGRYQIIDQASGRKVKEVVLEEAP